MGYKKKKKTGKIRTWLISNRYNIKYIHVKSIQYKKIAYIEF